MLAVNLKKPKSGACFSASYISYASNIFLHVVHISLLTYRCMYYSAFKLQVCSNKFRSVQFSMRWIRGQKHFLQSWMRQLLLLRVKTERLQYEKNLTYA